MANKTWNGSTGTWATSGSWSPTGVPAATDDVFINGGSVTIAGQTCNNLTIGGTCTIAGTFLTVNGTFTVNSGTITFSNTSTITFNGSISNPGGTITQSGTGSLVIAGTSVATADFGSNSLRTLTIAKTGGSITLQGSQINCTNTNTNSSTFTFTSGALTQNVVIQCGGITNTSTTARTWALNQDLIITANGNAITCSMNSLSYCNFTSRTGTVRIRSLTNGGNNTIIFPNSGSSAAIAASYCFNVALESNTNWNINGCVNNISIDGQHTGTVGSLNIFGAITSSTGDRTWTSLSIFIFNATDGGTSTQSIGGTTFAAATIGPLSGTTATFTINSLKAAAITCGASGTNSTYNLGVKDDDSQIVALSTNGTLQLGTAVNTFNVYNVRSYTTNMQGSGTYNIYHLEPNYYLANPPTAGITTHSAGTLTIKSGYTLTAWTFTSNSGTRTLNFENNSYITTLNNGTLNIGYLNLTSYCPYDNAGFLHQSTGTFNFTGTPTGTSGYDNLYNLTLNKVNNTGPSATVRNLVIQDGAGMTTAATLTFCYKFTGYTGTTISALSVVRSATIGGTSYVNYTGLTINTFTNSSTSGANQYIYNLNAQTITLGCTNGAYVYIGGDGTNTDGVVKTNTGNTVTLGGSATYWIYNLRAYNLALSNTGTYNCYYYEHNYFTNPPTAGTVTHTAGTLILKANTNNFSMNTWAFTSATGTRGITFEQEGYIQTLNTGALAVDYLSLTSVCPDTDNCGFYHASTGSISIGNTTAPTSPAATFHLNWGTRCVFGSNTYVKNFYNSYPRGDGLRIGGGLIGNTATATIYVSGNILFTGSAFSSGTIQNDSKWGLLNFNFWGAAARTSTYTTGYSDLGEGGEFRAFNALTLATTYTGTFKLNQIFSAGTTTHQGGTLDINGMQLKCTTSYTSTDGTVNKYITNTAATATSPDIYIAATSGTPWSFGYGNLLTCTKNIWVYVRGGTVSHGVNARSYTLQPSFDLTERVSAYTLNPNTDFRIGGLRINNYTVPSGSNWYIGGPELTVYTGGQTAPTSFTVYIVPSSRSGEICQMYVDNNTFTWPLVSINTNAKLTSATWKFKDVLIEAGTTTSNGQFVEIIGTLSSSGLGLGTLDITNSNWVFRGSGTVINYGYQSYGVNFISDSTGTATFDGVGGSNTGDQTARFYTNFGGKIVNNIGYNTSSNTGNLTLVAGSGTNVTKPMASQIDFNYSTSSILIALELDNQSAYGFPVKGSTFNIGTSSAGYRYIQSYGPRNGNWGIYNTESSTVVSGDYLNLTNCPAKGGNGWYAGTHSIDNGGNTGWTFAAPSTYSLSRSAATVDEGSSVTITLTTNALNGTLVPYTISGTNITSADISGASLTGNFTVSGGTAAVTLNIAADYVTEGNETVTLSLNNGQASISVTINDTSLTPTYSLSRSAATVTEGDSFTITLNTTNISNGTSVPYTITGTGITSSDINGASLTGNFTVNSNTASLVVITSWDYVTEGAETLTLTINPTYGTGSSISVVINNLLRPSYSLSASPTSLNEGSNFTITLTTTNVPDNTSVPYTITGTGITSADINNASLTGNFTVVSGTASVVFTTTGDYLTEGDETFTLTLDSIGTNVSVLIADYYKTRTYSLGTSASTVFEGESFTITLTTANVFNGTTVPYTITGVSSADIGGVSLTGNFTVNSNTAVQNFTATLDLVVEGNETFTLTLGSPASGSVNVIIKDPSTGSGGSFISFFED